MSNNQMPAWAQAMKARAEVMEHRLRTEMTRRFAQTHDDLTVNLARADIAIEGMQRLDRDVRKELSQLLGRLLKLEHWPEAGA